jgi:hypothetical protein
MGLTSILMIDRVEPFICPAINGGSVVAEYQRHQLLIS